MESSTISQVKKRDCSIALFNPQKICDAIFRAAKSVGGRDYERAKELTEDIVKYLEGKGFSDSNIPTVENVQDAVEKILIEEGHAKTAKAFIIYREQHKRLREFKSFVNSNDIMDGYLKETDWRVKENSNMSYSLQGLNNHISSIVSSNYWLHKVYPPEVRDAHVEGDFHLHDLQILASYCCGWDLQDLLLRGFGGASGKIVSRPPKHLRAALGQAYNFIYTLQGEGAGAQAFSSFDTLLAPFVRYDNLSYKEVKQAMQEFVFNMNVPTRVGFQCMSEDTDILTENGWRGHNQIKKGDMIATFNIEKGFIEYLPVKRLFAKEYKGKMYNLKNRISDQLISPEHRIVRKLFNADRYALERIEKVLELKSPFMVPVGSEGYASGDDSLDEDVVELLAWVIAEGSMDKGERGSGRISIYQSKKANPGNYENIISLCDSLGLSYTERTQKGLGEDCNVIRFNAQSTRRILGYFKGDKHKGIKFIPECITAAGVETSRLFLEAYIKGDGHEGCKISTASETLKDGLLQVAVNAGYGATVLMRKQRSGISKKDLYVLRLIRHKDTYITKVKQVSYSGVIWCPNTDNETVVARRKGKVFITGNTPFSNLTLDLKVPKGLANKPAIVGGKPMKENYGEFQEEMDMINRAFAEVMLEGDASGKVFTFPIPTYNVTSDLDWENPEWDAIWEMTAKYGMPYFANFINSDMDPEDARSMCLHPDEEIILRNSGNIKRLSLGEVVTLYKEGDFDEDGWIDCDMAKTPEVLSFNPETCKAEWSKIKRFLRVKDNRLIELNTDDGKKIRVSTKHLIPVLTQKGFENKLARDITEGDYLISLKTAEKALNNEYQSVGGFILNENLAKLLGYFTADGNYLFESRKNMKNYGRPRGMQFTFNAREPENISEIKELISNIFKTKVCEKKDPRYNTYYLYIYNTNLARRLFDGGFKKYGRLPHAIFNSPKPVIESFLRYHFKGDGYKKRGEIHINDEPLARDLVLLYSLSGQPVTYRKRKRSQVIYLQQKKSATKANGLTNNPLLCERVPGWMAKSTYAVPGLNKKRMVGHDCLEKHGAYTPESRNIKDSDCYIVRVKEVKNEKLENDQEFFDFELEKNHLFIHSMGTITHNCCRLRLDNRELRRKGGVFGAHPLTGSLGVVTLNLPRLGHIAKDEEDFMQRLLRLMDIASLSLEIKRKSVENFTESGLYPYSRHYLKGVKTATGSYWANHFSTIGIIGMNEACLNLFGKSVASKEGREFAMRVMDAMLAKLAEYQRKTGSNYNLEATPAEGATYRLAKLDKEKFPDIITAGDEEPYYTNSTHLPVNYTDDIFEALQLQDEIQSKYTGGCVEKGNKVLTDKGLLEIDYIVRNFKRLKPIKALSYNVKEMVGEWDEITDAVAIDVRKHDKIRVVGEKNLDIVTSDWHPFFVLRKRALDSFCPACGRKSKNVKGFASHLRHNMKCRSAYSVMQKYEVVEKRADELEMNDYILQNSSSLYPGGIKKGLDGDLMWLFGFFISDGCLSEITDNRGGNNLKRHTVRFFSEHMPVVKKVKNILAKHFKSEVKISQMDKRSKKLKQVSTRKKNVVESLFKYGFKSGEKVYDIGIPKDVKKNLTGDNVFSLLAGMIDGDGHISRDGDIEYYTVSEKLADDLLEVCTMAGIMVSKHRKPTKRKNEVDGYRIRIPSYQAVKIKEEIGAVNNSARIAKTLSDRKKRHLPVVRVKEVSKEDVEDNQFYDLTTRNNHNYLAGKNTLVFIHNTVLHGFLGERIDDIQTCKKLVKRIATNFKLPYFTLTPTFSICPIHGYLKGEHFECPHEHTKEQLEEHGVTKHHKGGDKNV